jgi:nucleotide-binding universal stress UspA family protein
VAKLFRRILVPHDFSDHATRALKVAADLAAEHRGRLTVLHVVYPYPVTPLAMTEAVPLVLPPDMVSHLKSQLEKLVRRVVRGRRAPRVVCRVELGDPTQQIIEVARQADSVVMSTEGRTGLGHLLIGSVAEKVVRHSPCPVLTLRAGRARAPRRRKRKAATRRRKRAA